MTPAQYAKALTAGAVAFLAGLGAAMADGDLTGAEGVIALGAGLAGLAAVFQVPNAPVEGVVIEEDYS